MFHLRETYMAATPSELNTTDFPNITSSRHSRSWVVGNLGAALDFNDEQERESDGASNVQERDGTYGRVETPIVSNNPLWDGLAAEMERHPSDV